MGVCSITGYGHEMQMLEAKQKAGCDARPGAAPLTGISIFGDVCDTQVYQNHIKMSSLFFHFIIFL